MFRFKNLVFLFFYFFVSQNLSASSGLDSLWRELKKENDPKNKLIIIEQLCDQLPVDSIQLNKELINRAIELSKAEKNKEKEAFFYYQLGNVCGKEGRLDDAHIQYKHSLVASKFIDEPNAICRAYCAIGNSYINRGVYDSALLFLDTANLYLAKLNADNQLHLLVNSKLGDAYMFKGEYYRALAYYDKILNESLYLDSLGKAKALKSKGSVYSHLGDYAKALDVQLDALKVYEELNNERKLAAMLNEIGIVYKNLNLPDKALSYHKRSLAIKEKRNNLAGMAVSYVNIGIVYNQMKNYGLALESYHKSLELKKRINTKKGVAGLYINIGLVYDETKQYEKAEEYYSKALEEAKKSGVKSYEVKALINLTSLYHDKKEYEKAIRFGKLSVEKALRLGAKREIAIAFYNLSNAYSEVKNFEEAYKMYLQYDLYKDSILNPEYLAKITLLEDRYNLYVKNSEMELQAKDLELFKTKETLRRSKTNLIIICLTFLLLVAILGVLFIQKGNRLKVKKLKEKNQSLGHEQELTAEKLKNEQLEKEHFEHQLAQLTQQMGKKNKQLHQMEEDIEKLREELISNKTKEHKGVVGTVLQFGQTKQDWDLFMEYFQKVYHDFLDRLKLQYQELTINDLRLCALIRLNLTTKEIASILNITVPSLRTTKYRLRKKILLKNESIEDFLLSF